MRRRARDRSDSWTLNGRHNKDGGNSSPPEEYSSSHEIREESETPQRTLNMAKPFDGFPDLR